MFQFFSAIIQNSDRVILEFRFKMSLENDVGESEEEQKLFDDDIIVFNQAMNEENNPQ